MFPEVPRYYHYQSDNLHTDMDLLNKTLEAQGSFLGIPINIESNSKNDYMFHQIKAPSTPQEAKDFERGGGAARSPEFQAFDKDPKYIELCEKLYKITGQENLLKPIKRLTKLRAVFTQIEIAKTHGLP